MTPLAPNPNRPSIAIAFKAPDNSKPGVEEIVDACCHICNAMIALDHVIETQHPENIDNHMQHILLLVDSIGPQLAEVEQPLEVMTWVFYRINQTVVESFMQTAQMRHSLGFSQDVGPLMLQQDHILAIINQAYNELAYKHLQAIEFMPVVGDGSDG